MLVKGGPHVQSHFKLGHNLFFMNGQKKLCFTIKNIYVQIFNDLATNQTTNDFYMSIIFQEADQQYFTYALK